MLPPIFNNEKRYKKTALSSCIFVPRLFTVTILKHGKYYVNSITVAIPSQYRRILVAESGQPFLPLVMREIADLSMNLPANVVLF